MRNKGFTLIEIIIYIGIISGVLVAFISYSLAISSVNNKNHAMATVQSDERIALETIIQKIRSASAVNYPTNGSSQNQLSLVTGTGISTSFSLNGGRLQMSETGQADILLTSNRTTISSLSFTNLAQAGERGNIMIQMTVDYNVPSQNVDYKYGNQVETAASLRR